MKLGINFGQESIDVFADQILAGVPQYLVNVVCYIDDLASSMKDIIGDIDRSIDHN